MWGVLTLPLYAHINNTTMQLGTTVHIAVSCKDIQSSLPFYHTLGFTTLFIDNEMSPSFVRLTDGAITLALIAEDFGTPSLAYFTTGLQESVARLQQLHIDVQTDTDPHGDITQAHFVNPDGLHVWLHPAGKNSKQTAGGPNTVCGTFGELSMSVRDLDSSILYWQSLGYELLHRSLVPYPYAIVKDGAMLLGLHQNNEVSHPALTYYAPDMADRIEQLKHKGISFVKDFPAGTDGRIHNAVAKAPDGQLFFLFEGDI
jgi:catechol 2,3-dioxygenase-like lactoylglutathione lyase family enzyme